MDRAPGHLFPLAGEESTCIFLGFRCSFKPMFESFLIPVSLPGNSLPYFYRNQLFCIGFSLYGIIVFSGSLSMFTIPGSVFTGWCFLLIPIVLTGCGCLFTGFRLFIAYRLSDGQLMPVVCETLDCGLQRKQQKDTIRQCSGSPESLLKQYVAKMQFGTKLNK